MANAIILNLGKIQAKLSFTMTLSEWKQIKKTLESNQAYTEMTIIREINDLVRQLEQSFYSDCSTPD